MPDYNKKKKNTTFNKISFQLTEREIMAFIYSSLLYVFKNDVGSAENFKFMFSWKMLKHSELTPKMIVFDRKARDYIVTFCFRVNSNTVLSHFANTSEWT